MEKIIYELGSIITLYTIYDIYYNPIIALFPIGNLDERKF